MASKFPARNFYEIEFTYGLWWEQDVGGDIFPDSPHLLVSAIGDLAAPAEYARCALKFSTTVPGWASVGDIAERHAVLFLYCNSMGNDGAQGLKIGAVDWAWTMATAQGTMRAEPGGGWSGVITPTPLQGQGWVAINLEAAAATYLQNANGLVLKANVPVSPTGAVAYQFLKSPAPIGRAYLWYDIEDTVHASATDRLEASAAAIAALGQSRSLFSINGSIIQSHRLPDESDVSIDVGKGSSLSLIKHAVTLPETWQMERGERGALTLSRSAVDALDYRGALLEVSLSQRVGQTAAETVAILKGIIGSVEKTQGAQNITIDDALYEALASYPYYRDPMIGLESVNVLTEQRMYALLLILINGGAIPWSRFRQADLVWLLRRFGVVWDDITVSSVDMADYTVGSFVAEFGRQFALCLSRGVDDSVVVWHPAVYRPSMRVWSVDDRDLADIVYKKVSMIDKYQYITLDDVEIGTDEARPLALDGNDKKYPVPDLTGIFASSPYPDVTQGALGRQLAARLVEAHEEYHFTAGAQAIVWEVGDKLKITSVCNELDAAVFTITSIDGDPSSGKNAVTALRWPGSPGLQSTWENTGLQGIYRLAEWDTGNATGANQSPIGSAGALTVNTLDNLKYIDWRGPMGNVDLTAPDPWFPSFTNYDLVDFPVAILGRQSTNPYSGGGPDETYTILMKCQDATPSDKAVIVYIKRVARASGGGDYYPTTDLRIGLGYTTDYTTDPIIFNSYVETPPGLSTSSWAWIYGVAVQWHGDKVRLYVDQTYIGEITALDELLTDVTFTTPVHTEHKIGCIRWLQRADDWFGRDRLIGKLGKDNYYP